MRDGGWSISRYVNDMEMSGPGARGTCHNCLRIIRFEFQIHLQYINVFWIFKFIRVEYYIYIKYININRNFVILQHGGGIYKSFQKDFRNPIWSQKPSEEGLFLWIFNPTRWVQNPCCFHGVILSYKWPFDEWVYPGVIHITPLISRVSQGPTLQMMFEKQPVVQRHSLIGNKAQAPRVFQRT